VPYVPSANKIDAKDLRATMILKSSTSIQPWEGSSSTLVTTPVSTGSDPRFFHLSRVQDVPPPVISASEFVPRALVTHLMRNKKDSAIAVKYRSGDKITNMEGALHTFITPIVRILMFGDYVFRGSHGVSEFTDDNGKQRAREVLMSALVQMDFENRHVMLAVSKLETDAIYGEKLKEPYEVMSVRDKRDATKRTEYDLKLRKHMIAHLTQDSYLPSRASVHGIRMSRTDSLRLLENYIMSPTPNPQELIGKYTKINNSSDDVVSLELLVNAAMDQLRNELSALEILAPQGYIYTYDPASIFAREIGADFLNRTMLAALKTLSSAGSFTNMKAYAFNDYADKGAIKLVQHALERQSHVRVLSKSDLFRGTRDAYDASMVAGGEGSWLVVHNNSDGFGQNIETEGAGGSLDGALGANSSAAASMERGRKDLLSYVF
jgi:hypothetical protein